MESQAVKAAAIAARATGEPDPNAVVLDPNADPNASVSVDPNAGLLDPNADPNALDESVEGVEGGEGDEGEGEGQPQTFTVEINGQEQQVTEDELKTSFAYRGQLLAQQQHYEKQFEQALEGVQEQGQKYHGRLQNVRTILSALAPEMPDFKNLAPEQVAGAVERWEKQKQLIGQIETEAEAEEQRQQQRQQQVMQQRLQRENSMLLSIMPEWRDDAKRSAEIREISTYMQQEIGYSAEELESAGYDHRNILLFRAAMHGHRAMTARGTIKKTVTQPGPQDGRGGNSMNPKEHTRLDGELLAKASAPGATAEDRIALMRHRHPRAIGSAPAAR